MATPVGISAPRKCPGGADAFILKHLRVLQYANARGVRRVGDDCEAATRDRSRHERVLEFVGDTIHQRGEIGEW
jgi:hypothetical protein